jgi:plasmid stabilization system protein ParE
MIVRFHRKVRNEAAEAQDYYEQEAGPEIAERFLAALLSAVQRAAANPRHCHPLDHRLRRANLKHFPYHFLFEVRDGYIYIIVLRHHKRHPSYGLKRR